MPTPQCPKCLSRHHPVVGCSPPQRPPDAEHRCPKCGAAGSISLGTKGDGPWWCREHFTFGR